MEALFGLGRHVGNFLEKGLLGLHCPSRHLPLDTRKASFGDAESTPKYYRRSSVDSKLASASAKSPCELAGQSRARRLDDSKLLCIASGTAFEHGGVPGAGLTINLQSRQKSINAPRGKI